MRAVSVADKLGAAALEPWVDAGRGERNLVDDDEPRHVLELVDVVEHLEVPAGHLQVDRDLTGNAVLPSARSA